MTILTHLYAEESFKDDHGHSHDFVNGLPIYLHRTHTARLIDLPSQHCTSSFPNSARQFEGINKEAVDEPQLEIVDKGHGKGISKSPSQPLRPCTLKKASKMETAGIVMLRMVNLWFPIYLHTLKYGLCFPSQDSSALYCLVSQLS